MTAPRASTAAPGKQVTGEEIIYQWSFAIYLSFVIEEHEVMRIPDYLLPITHHSSLITHHSDREQTS